MLAAPGGESASLTGVSCTGPGDCTAVGGAGSSGVPVYVTESAGTWGTMTAATAPGSGAAFTGVSCTSTTECSAVGFDWAGSNANLGNREPIYATEAAGSWGAVTALPAPGVNGDFLGDSCTGAGTCTAVGESSAHVPVYATESAGTWSAVTGLSATGGSAQFASVSCTAATTCTAAGSNIEFGGGDLFAQPYVTTELSGTWGQGDQLSTPGNGTGQFNGVSCAELGDCTAVGTTTDAQPFHAVEVAGTWRTAVEPESTGGLAAVSCVDAADCTAVGGGEDGEPMYWTESSGTWGPVTELAEPGARFDAVSCTDASDCTAVGQADISGHDYAIYASEVAGTWSAVTVLSSLSVFNGVSCTDADDCVAVGIGTNGADATPLVDVETAGTWGPVTELTAPLDSTLSAVSCASTASCVAVGADDDGPIELTETSGSWGAATQFTTPAPGSGVFEGVSCTTTTACTAVGYDHANTDPYTPPQAIYATTATGAWSAATELTSTTGAASLGAVSCSSATECVAVGQNALEGASVAATVATPPRIGTATRGNARATVAFSAPTSDGGAPVTGYKVLASTGVGYAVATTSPATCKASPCTVTGLKNGKAYTFEVVATTAFGTSPRSAPSNRVTPATLPAAPVLGKVTASSGSIEIRWSAPRTDGGSPITHYTATAAHTGTAIHLVTTATSCTVTGLVNGRTYSVWVTATNAVGTSAKSARKSATP